MSFIKNIQKGFTLIEALIAILLLSLVIAGISNLVTTNLTSERDRIIMECLVNVANSAIEMCRGGVNPPPQMECAGLEITIEIQGNCNIPFPDNWYEANCKEVEVNATYENENKWRHGLKDLICKFGPRP